MSSHGELLVKAHVIGIMLRGVNAALEEDIKTRIKGLGITPAGFRVLWITQFVEKIPMSQLSYIIQLNISSIFRQVLKLETEGLVIIEEADDMRVKEVCLTDQGREYVKRHLIDPNLENFRFLSLINGLHNDDFFQLLTVGTKVCDEILGPEYMKWALQSATKLKKDF